MNAAWDQLFDALVDQMDPISVRVREGMQTYLPAYRMMETTALDREVRLEVARVLESARAGRATVSDRELIELAAVGETRARQGVPMEEMLRAWRIGVQVVVGYARKLGARLGIGGDDVLEFVESVLAWTDIAMITTAGAHRKAELERAREELEYREAFVRGVLFGTLSPAKLKVGAGGYGVDPGSTYVAVRARSTNDVGRTRLERALGFEAGLQQRGGLSASINGDLVGFLRQPPAGEVDGVVGVGPAQPLDRLAESFRLATRALETATGFGMVGIYDIPRLGLRAAVSADRDVGDALIARYIDPLMESGWQDELVTTMRIYLECGMRVETAAQLLFVHQNTLRYRIGRFEELTGVSLRDPGVAFEVWWALERSSLKPPEAE